MIIEIFISFFLIAGSAFVLIASIGILRMPDIYMRLHASTKATSLGLTLLLTGLMIFDPVISTIIKSLAVIIFLYLTIPVSANLLGKSALEMKSFQWQKEKDKKANDK